MASKNHLLALSTLLLLNSVAVASSSHQITFAEQHDETINGFEEDVILNEVSDQDLILRTAAPTTVKVHGPSQTDTFTNVRFNKTTSLENYSSFSLIELTNDSEKKRFDFDGNVSINTHTDNINLVSIFSLTNIANLGSKNESLVIDISSRYFSHPNSAEVYGLQITDSTLNDETLPNLISITAYLDTDIDEGQVQAMSLFGSHVQYNGRLQLVASQNIPQRPENVGEMDQTLALMLEDSNFQYHSAGQTLIVGDIAIFGESELCLTLNDDQDMFVGRIYDNDAEKISASTLELRNGAQWQTRGKQQLGQLIWGKGGIVEVSAESPVSLNSENRGNSVEIEHGAILRVSLTDDDINTPKADQFKLKVGDASAKGDDNVQINVQITDLRTEKSDVEGIAVGLIGTDGGTFAGIHALAEPHRYENALGEFETTAQIGLGDADVTGIQGLYITAIETTRLGPSTLVKNMLDYASFEQIRHEQVGFNNFSILADRIVNEPERGLWVDVSHRETQLSLSHRSRESEFNTQALTIGYDRNFETKWLNEAFYGGWVSVAKNEFQETQASADAESVSAALYAGGITEDGYRIIMQAHYTFGSSSFETPAMLNGLTANLDYDVDTSSYGLGLYVGLGQKTWGNFSVEPYVAGYTYWLDSYDTNIESGIAFEAEKIHQSLAALGVHTSWSSQTLTLAANASWIHRFGKSAQFRGFDHGQAENFETEDLQESWGLIGAQADWRYSTNFHLKLRGSVGISEVVKPQYEIGAQAQYFF